MTERVGAREGWRVKTFGRGIKGQKPFFHVIDFWLEKNRLLIEVATPAMAQEYLDFLPMSRMGQPLIPDEVEPDQLLLFGARFGLEQLQQSRIS